MLLVEFCYNLNTHRSSTVSASSSVFEYVEEHGRTYHKYKEGSKSSRADIVKPVVNFCFSFRIYLAE